MVFFAYVAKALGEVKHTPRLSLKKCHTNDCNKNSELLKYKVYFVSACTLHSVIHGVPNFEFLI